jgi:uncharacterized protein
MPDRIRHAGIFPLDGNMPNNLNPEQQDISKMKYFLCVIGMVMMLEGLPYLGFPDKMKAMMKMVIQMPDESLRKIGFVLMAGGLLLVYFGRM